MRHNLATIPAVALAVGAIAGCGGSSQTQARACWKHAALAAEHHIGHALDNYGPTVAAAQRQRATELVRYELASARTYKHGHPAGDMPWVRQAQKRCGAIPENLH